MLPDKGSNLDIQIQNLTYYHYTIGQWEGKITTNSFSITILFHFRRRDHDRYFCMPDYFTIAIPPTVASNPNTKLSEVYKMK